MVSIYERIIRLVCLLGWIIFLYSALYAGTVLIGIIWAIGSGLLFLAIYRLAIRTPTVPVADDESFDVQPAESAAPYTGPLQPAYLRRISRH